MPKLKEPHDKAALLAVGARVRALRERERLSARGLAKALGDEGRYKSEISRSELGTKPPSQKLVTAIREKYGVDVFADGVPPASRERVMDSDMVSPNLATMIADRKKEGRPLSDGVRQALMAMRNETGDLSVVGWRDLAEDLEVAGRRAARTVNRADQDEGV